MPADPSSAGSSSATLPPATPTKVPSPTPPASAAGPQVSQRPSTGSLRSPHSSRHPSMSMSMNSGGLTMADLLASPPLKGDGKPVRDWRTVKVAEVLEEGGRKEMKWVELDTPVETACQMLIDHDLSSLPIRAAEDAAEVVGTFDYSDLNAFLLLIMGVYKPEEDEDLSSFEELAKKARAGSSIAVNLVKDLGKKDPFITVASSDPLASLVEIFGSGVHQVAVVADGTQRVIGMLSQLRLLKYFWENGRSFPSIEQLYPSSLRQLNIGSAAVMSIQSDKRVIDALELMNAEGVSSLAVVDSMHNVVGNMETAHVRYLTRSSSIPLLKSTCLHFVSVVLTDKGLDDGKDAYPVFHVSPASSLAHTVAKLVATQAHRMWITQPPSPSSTPGPTTPTHPSIPTHHHSASSSSSSTALPAPQPIPPPPSISPSLATSALTTSPWASSGVLTGVVSLTDILNLFARSAGLTPVDPDEARRSRRRSSSSSFSQTGGQSARNSVDLRELRERASRGSFEIRR